MDLIDRLLRRHYRDQIRVKTVCVYVGETDGSLVGRAFDLTDIPDHLPARPGNEVTERWLIVGEVRPAITTRSAIELRWIEMITGRNEPQVSLALESLPGLRRRFWEARWAARLRLSAWAEALRQIRGRWAA